MVINTNNMTSIEWLVNKIEIDIVGIEYDYADEIKQAKEMHRQEIIEELIGFQIFLNNKKLITNHDWDYDKLAKQYVKSLNKTNND